MTKDAPFKRLVRQRMSRTGESYATARARLERRAAGQAFGGTPDDDVLNITNGDVVADLLAGPGGSGPGGSGPGGTGPGSRVLPWRDVLHDGPVPGGVSPKRLQEVRARYIAGQGFSTYEAVLADFERRDRTLEEFSDRSYVLWFEADLYDQLQIIQILDRLGGLGVPATRIRLVCIGEYPGVAHFAGLGQLDRPALLGLLETAAPLTHADLDGASKAWQAFTAPSPSRLAQIARTSSTVLRFLGEAFGRLMREYPSATDGLSLTQRRILLAIEDGAETAAEAFAELGRRERRPYLGDWSAYAMMQDLATARRSLLSIEGPAAVTDPGYGRQRVRLTTDGRDVLAGRADHVDLNGIDRWIGGVHLHTASCPRYDERREALVIQGSSGDE